MSLGLKKFSFRPGLNLILGTQVELVSVLGKAFAEFRQIHCTSELLDFDSRRTTRNDPQRLRAFLRRACAGLDVVMVHNLPEIEGHTAMVEAATQNPTTILIWGLNSSWEPSHRNPLNLHLRHAATTILECQGPKLKARKTMWPRNPMKVQKAKAAPKTLWDHLLEDE